LLLKIGRPFSKLDRRLSLLLFAASLSPACIIPVAPDFQDPLGVPNAAPEILNPNPPAGAEVFATPGPPQHFTFNTTDVNDDALFFEFIIGTAVTPQQPVPGNQVDLGIGCPQLTTDEQQFSHHKIAAVVADREFADDNSATTPRVKDSGKAVRIDWTLNLTCALSP